MYMVRTCNVLYVPLCVVHLLSESEEGAHWVGSSGEDEDKWSGAVDVLVQGGEVNGWTLHKQGTKVLHHKCGHSRCHLQQTQRCIRKYSTHSSWMSTGQPCNSCTSTGHTVTVQVQDTQSLYKYRTHSHCTRSEYTVTVQVQDTQSLYKVRTHSHCTSTGHTVTVQGQNTQSLYKYRTHSHCTSTGYTVTVQVQDTQSLCKYRTHSHYTKTEHNRIASDEKDECPIDTRSYLLFFECL